MHPDEEPTFFAAHVCPVMKTDKGWARVTFFGFNHRYGSNEAKLEHKSKLTDSIYFPNPECVLFAFDGWSEGDNLARKFDVGES
mgnify:CR=1 FL=1